MSTQIQQLKVYPVRVGSIQLYLTAYQLTGNASIQEQGTADGSTSLTACWPKKSRLTLKGKLASDAAQTAVMMDAILQQGAVQNVQIASLNCPACRLIGYTLKEDQSLPEISLVFLTGGMLTQIEEISGSEKSEDNGESSGSGEEETA